MSRKIIFLLLSIVFFAESVPAQEASTFRTWGEEILNTIETNFRHRNYRYLYREVKDKTDMAFAWPLGIQMKALIYAGEPDKADKLYAEMKRYYQCTARGYDAFNASISGCDDRYYDDNAWIAKDLLDLHEKQPQASYIEQAKTILRFCMSGECPGGGIRFHETHSQPAHSDYNHAAICATAPTACVNLRLHQITQEEAFLQDGKRLYDFLKSQGWGIGYGYRGYENAVILQAALLLYEITNDTVYLNDARQLGYSMQACYISWQSGRLNEVGVWGGHDMTDAYVHLYETDNNPYWLSIAGAYLSYLHDNCLGKNGFYPEEWNDTAKDGKRSILMDQAAVAAAYMKMASTPGAPPYEPEPVAVFKHADWNNGNEGGSWSIGLQPGEYTKSDLVFRGMTDNRFHFVPDISSVIVSPGYKLTLYSEDLFQGRKIEYTSTQNYLSAWNDKAVSLKVEKIPTSIQPAGQTINLANLPDDTVVEIFDLTGKRLFESKINKNHYDLDRSAFPAGMVLLRLSTNNEIIVKKLIL